MNFDQPLQIDHTGESKYNSDTLKAIYGNEVLSFWMAETDFPCPPNISKALKQMTEKGSYTYQYKTESLKNSICAWFKMRHGLKMEVPNLLFTSGVMTGIAAAIDVFSNIGDGIIIQPPVYHEFKSTIVDAKREVVKNSLIENESGYKIDFEDLEKKAADGKNRILLLCSPHNPVGRVWSKDEMLNIVEICKKTDTLLLSDEIHADIILNGNTFFGAIEFTDVYDRIIMFGSPGKTFGIPGISDAFVYTNNEELYEKMNTHIHRHHLLKINAFSNVATEAGYAKDSAWLDEMLQYVQGNRFYKGFC